MSSGPGMIRASRTMPPSKRSPACSPSRVRHQKIEKAAPKIGAAFVGCHDETEKSCQKSGIAKRAVENSLEIFGQYKKLPSDEILQLTTMCGHGMVPANLVERVITQIKRGKKTLREGALELTRPCHCGIYNPVRAERLLRRLVPLVTLDV